MKTVTEKLTKWERHACGMFLSEYPTDASFDDILGMIEADDDDVVIWQPFEMHDRTELAKLVKETAEGNAVVEEEPVHVAVWIEGGVLQHVISGGPVVLHVFDVDDLGSSERDEASKAWKRLVKVHRMRNENCLQAKGFNSTK